MNLNLDELLDAPIIESKKKAELERQKLEKEKEELERKQREIDQQQIDLVQQKEDEERGKDKEKDKEKKRKRSKSPSKKKSRKRSRSKERSSKRSEESRERRHRRSTRSRERRAKEKELERHELEERSRHERSKHEERSRHDDRRSVKYLLAYEDRGRFEDRYRYDDRERRERRYGRDIEDKARYEERGRERERERSPRPPRKVSPEKPALTEEERDARTVFVSQLSARLNPREFKEFFSQCGKVRDVRIVFDRVTGRSKGVGYVEFEDPNSIPAALLLTGEKLLGAPLIVQETLAQKNRVAEMPKNPLTVPGITLVHPSQVNITPMVGSAAGITMGPASGITPGSNMAAPIVVELPNPRVYCSFLHPNLNEDDIRPFFESFGEINEIALVRDPKTKVSKGVAYVSKTLRVKFEMSNLGKNDIDFEDLLITSKLEALKKEITSRLSKKELEDDTHDNPLLIRQILPTDCILLKNAFDPTEEYDENWVKEIEEDFKNELENYGKIDKILLLSESLKGYIFCKFEDIESSKEAQKMMHGRFFCGRQLECQFVPEEIYIQKFKILESESDDLADKTVDKSTESKQPDSNSEVVDNNLQKQVNEEAKDLSQLELVDKMKDSSSEVVAKEK
ncbi:hypothetical protein HK099_004160 [Clydaea vesicula]|uniref:RRM domain-containing protein n=1 Tax=Clydaea vesicula TaxID=447962 RepID=A0AAD5XYD1_9FUNG|nr:hypothetical protein HK099_004160 [Clydaea vesicula]